MSFDALIMPSASPPPAGGGGSAPGTPSDAFEPGQSAQAADPDQRFLATLNRACEGKSCSPAGSREGASQSVKSAAALHAAAHAKDNRCVTDQKPLQDRAVESEACASVTDLPVACGQPSLGLLHPVLWNMAFASEGAAEIEGQSDLNTASIHAFVNELIGHVYSNGHSQLSGPMGIGPFEQLQVDISAQASNLHFFKQLAIQALNDQLTADPTDRRADHPFFELRRSLEGVPIKGANHEGRLGAFVARVDQLIDSLLQHYTDRPAAGSREGAPPEAGGQKAAMTMAAPAAHAHLLLQKMIEPKQPAAEMQAIMAGRDGNGPAGTVKNVSAEALLQARIDKNSENAAVARMQPGSKTAEPVVNSNLAGQNVAVRSAEEAFGLKTSALQNDLRSADQTGYRVIQIDGESKDSGFLTSQENLPEHLSKLENGSRLTEGSQRSLTSQTMNQIVQKAVLLSNNGQNTVQIDLKPDFLGHIRMHIMTESHQVTVRIVAELPFVKDMLENNLNQLKTELQAQGLQVDELEVSVAHDDRAEDDRYQKAADVRRARGSRSKHIIAEGDAASQEIGSGVEPDGMAQTAVDYFA
jgi:flagellar hook-length control protein FliK